MQNLGYGPDRPLTVKIATRNIPLYRDPAVMLTDTAPLRYRYYHTPDDTPDKIDFSWLARVVNALNGGIGELERAG